MKIYRDSIETEYTFLPAATWVNKPATESVTDQSLAQRLSLYIQRYRTRKVLRGLPDWQLADIGLTQEQAKQEGMKPFWKA